MSANLLARLTAVAVAVASVAGCALLPAQHTRHERQPTQHAAPSPSGVQESPLGVVIPPLPVPPAPDQLALLPEARYDAVIPGLISYRSETVPEVSYEAYQLSADAAVYGEDRIAPVARLAARNFLAGPTAVVPVELQPGWAEVLTPARNSLPSDGEDAAAQTAGWIPIELLTNRTDVHRRIDISLSKRTLTIWQSAMLPRTWEIGIGMPDAPTPSGVSGYLQAQYLDPRQGQSEHRIQLTSLHSTAADEPYAGAEGGLIALHFAGRSTGEVSHGCLRLDADAIEAVDSLPLGTPITILP